jgi:hypothetical protein
MGDHGQHPGAAVIAENPPAKRVTAITTQVNHHRPRGESVTVLLGTGKEAVKLEFSYEMAKELGKFFRIATQCIDHARAIREERGRSRVEQSAAPGFQIVGGNDLFAESDVKGRSDTA